MSAADKSLLGRLRALKGGSSGVTLDRSSNALNVSLAGIEPANPPSREDALAARLRSLRNTPEREEPLPPPPLQSTAKVPHGTAHHRGETAGLSPASPRAPRPAATPPAPSVPDDVLQTDDQTLEDLLSDQEPCDPKAESVKVNALLEELSKASPARHSPHKQEDNGHAKESRDQDDSDGEDMVREVDHLVSQALDGAKLNAQPGDVPDPPASDGGQDETGRRPAEADEDDQGEAGAPLSLPSVPSNIAPPKQDDSSLPDLGLPSVPSGAVKPKHDAESDFDNDIAARMAALSGLGGSSSDMGLPSVPTFQPADRAVKRLTSKTGYTDEDAETWCTVCLEDATLQCMGCEDVYCKRCWYEMHVGPAAAFDDRTHKAVQFVKPKKDQQKRVAMGAS
ncbi:Abscission/NoCut checkpoint regulator [Colletotrichum sidae]|uniref:Abscission/NoCut checkpoint regulator n=1 Tax=Colletotrichum sidae TaxID=1347389 RepID=A0A4R8TKN8_9PEZI|nr:Abscission/NoCut checkpoint regulator [Colletotrichum sidae]